MAAKMAGRFECPAVKLVFTVIPVSELKNVFPQESLKSRVVILRRWTLS